MAGGLTALFARWIEPKHPIPAERQRYTNEGLKRLIAPIIIEQFLAMLVGLADTTMISYAGEAAVSGVSLVNQLNNVFILLFSALASGGAVVASQYLGRRDREAGSLAAGQLVMMTALISLLLTAVALVFGRGILSLLFGRVEPEVMGAATVYLRISAYSFPFLALYNACAGLFQLSKVALSSIVALFGTVQIAANGVAQSFWSVAALFNSAIGPAFITVIGQYMGAGDVEGAEYYQKKLLRITFIGTALWCLVFFGLTFPLLGIFGLSAEAKRLVVWLCLIHNIGCSIFCPVAFPLSNGLRAAGDVFYTTAAAIFSTVVCRVALSYLFGVVCGWGVIGIGLAMAGDWCIKAALIWGRFRSGKWKEKRII